MPEVNVFKSIIYMKKVGENIVVKRILSLTIEAIFNFHIVQNP